MMRLFSPYRSGLAAGILAMTTALAAAQPERQFRAGAATSNITPPLGTSINGNMRDGRAQHVHDELHARCVVLDDGRTRLAFAVVDSCMLPRAVTDAARRFVAAEIGLPPDNLLISATHSHSAGTCAPVFQSEPDADYPRFVARRIADGVRRATNNLAPAAVGWGSAAVPEEVFNRRWHMKPGSIPPNPFGGADRVQMNPGAANPNLMEPAGPTDPEVAFLSVTTAAGAPLAVLANYSLHYVGGVGPGHVSADYFGVFAARLGELLKVEGQDPPFVGIMSNGTSGNINNINFRVPGERLPPYQKMRRVGHRVSAAVHAALRGVRYRPWVPLAAAHAELTLGIRRPTGEDVARAREILGRAKPGEPLAARDEIYARETTLLAAYPPEDTLFLQALRVGDVAIAAVPCEVFVEIGLELKRASPVKPLFTVSLANGYSGYLPTPEHHELGGYETWRARSSYLEPQASRKITARLLELLRRLAG